MVVFVILLSVVDFNIFNVHIVIDIVNTVVIKISSLLLVLHNICTTLTSSLVSLSLVSMGCEWIRGRAHCNFHRTVVVRRDTIHARTRQFLRRWKQWSPHLLWHWTTKVPWSPLTSAFDKVVSEHSSCFSLWWLALTSMRCEQCDVTVKNSQESHLLPAQKFAQEFLMIQWQTT
jgi:hypothetical protein